MTLDELHTVSDAFRALAQPRRLELFKELLAAGAEGVELARLRAATDRPSTLSMHLKALRRGRLIFESDAEPRRVHADVDRLAVVMRALHVRLAAPPPTM